MFKCTLQLIPTECIVLIWISVLTVFVFFSSNYKDFVDDTCMTPDCVGSVINVQIYDSDGLKTEVQYFLQF